MVFVMCYAVRMNEFFEDMSAVLRRALAWTLALALVLWLAWMYFVLNA